MPLLRLYGAAEAGGPRIREALAAFNGNINKKNYIGKLFYLTAITITQKNIGVISGSFLAPAVSLTPLRNKLVISKSNIFANYKPYAKRS
jgi:hypothetical protein